jgi:DNA-binding LacI/PurR family transcriptional regulator
MVSKRATSFDVARRAGVSRTTVSFVLNNLPGVSIAESTRQRVLDAARELNYHPDAAGRKLASGVSNTLGFVMRQSAEQVFSDAFLVQVVLGVEQVAAQNGFHVLLKPLEPDTTSGYTRLIYENLVDGIILSGPREDDYEIVKLHQDGVPVVLQGQLPNSSIPFVDINAVEGARVVVDHLISTGHHKIGIITNASLHYTSARQRCDGYCQALEKAGIPVDQNLILEGNYTPDSGYTAMQNLLATTPDVSAVFVASDVVAMGAIQAIKESSRRIPEDIAVAGFDDIPLARYYDPPLTTVSLPAFGLGWAAGERLIHLIQGEPLEQQELFLDSKLIIRKSTTIS